jgi:SPP1 gp7 family putative phage head morphogenesis protein
VATPVVDASINWDAWTPGSIPAARQASKLDELIATAVGRNPGWSDRAAQRGSLLASIEDHRLDRLASAVADAVARGDSVDQLAQVLQGVLDDSRWAELVATTEMNRAMTAASLASYADAGIEGKSWLTSSDDMVCDPCNDNEAAGPIPLDAPFPTGDDGPPQHGRCRCCVLPELILPTDAPAASDTNPLLPTIPDVPAHPTAGSTREVAPSASPLATAAALAALAAQQRAERQTPGTVPETDDLSEDDLAEQITELPPDPGQRRKHGNKAAGKG